MSYNVSNCVADLANTGLSNCLDELGHTIMLLWTPESFEIDTEANAKLEATYEAAINGNNMYPFPQAEEIEDTSEDDVIQETAIGTKIFVREGKYSETLRMRVSLCDLAKLRTFNNVSGRVFIVVAGQQHNKIFGTSPDGAKFKGFKLSELNVSKLKGTDGTTARMVDVRYQLAQPSEMADYPAIPEITAWDPASLTGLIDVTVEVTASSATELTVSVTGNCDGQGITGLVVGDFTLLDDEGNSESIVGIVDNDDGTYTFDVTTLVADDYTLNLKAASAQTTGGYAPGAADSFTIS